MTDTDIEPMIMAEETRAALDGCEIRAVDDTAGRRSFKGLAAPWDRWALIAGAYEERFQRNCFARAITDGRPLPLLVGHNSAALPVGRSTTLVDAESGLWGEWELSDTEQAREAWTLIRDGALTGLSVGFTPLRGQDHYATADPPDFPKVTRRNVRLREVSLVPAGAYDEALISLTRTATAVGSSTPYRDRYLSLLESVRYGPQ
jgi:HK97 family phage prohead protease